MFKEYKITSEAIEELSEIGISSNYLYELESLVGIDFPSKSALINTLLDLIGDKDDEIDRPQISIIRDAITQGYSIFAKVLLAVLISVGALIIYLAGVLIISWPISQTNVEKAGQLGDSFGAMTALFTALAFAGMIYAILLQRQELMLQRFELKLTRKEFSAQTKVFEQQVELTEKQLEAQVRSYTLALEQSNLDKDRKFIEFTQIFIKNNINKLDINNQYLIRLECTGTKTSSPAHTIIRDQKAMMLKDKQKPPYKFFHGFEFRYEASVTAKFVKEIQEHFNLIFETFQEFGLLINKYKTQNYDISDTYKVFFSKLSDFAYFCIIYEFDRSYDGNTHKQMAYLLNHFGKTEFTEFFDIEKYLITN